MDNEARIDGELHSPQTMDEQHNQFAGAFFPQAQHFVVAGGNFKSITDITQARELPSDFRRFPMGDLDLRHEIRLGRSGEVYGQHGRRSARRVYSARIHGSASNMTVALYQGDHAEEDWWEHISQYSRHRHPNVVQLFGVASACRMHAAIFKEELIPAKQLFVKYSGSHLWMVYLWSFLNTEFYEFRKYSAAVLGYSLHSWDCTLWIRPSTGRLCVDPTTSDYSGLDLEYLFSDAPLPSTLSVLEPPEANIVDSLSLDGYHEICHCYFRHYRQLSISMNTSVQLGAVISAPPGPDIDHSNEIACIPDQNIDDWGWSTETEASLTVLDSGWTRVNSSELSHGYKIHRSIYAPEADSGWLAQAHHVFRHLGITSNHDDYIVIHSVEYELKISGSGNSIPPGYLFLCSLADLQLDIPSCFRLPDCPAYWSHDPSGAERLKMEEVEQLGFPIFTIEVKVGGWSWDENVYNGTRQFQKAKGFDPDSQDVARELGYPLFKILKEPDQPFAHVEEIWDEPSEIQKLPESYEYLCNCF